MKYWYDYSGAGHDVATCSGYIISQNVYENYSDIQIKCGFYTSDENRIGRTENGWVDGKIGNEVVKTESVEFTVSRDETIIATINHRVYHNEDGTATVPIQLKVWTGVYPSYSGWTVSGDFVLDTISRGFYIESANDITLGNNCYIVLAPSFNTSSNDLYCRLAFSIGDWSASTEMLGPYKDDQKHTYDQYVISGNIADANGNTIYYQMPNSVYGSMTATLYTYLNANDDMPFSSSSKTFTVSIPEDVKPEIGEVVLTPQAYDLLLQNNNSIQISALSCAAGTGSNIASYSYSGPNVSVTSTQSSMISGRISVIGTLEYTVTVTDTRGRATSASSTIECLPYMRPSITFDAFRSNNEGVADNNGRYITCKYTPKFASVKNADDEELNGVSVKIFFSNKDMSNVTESMLHNETSEQTVILDSIDLITYDVYAYIVDNFGGEYASNIVTIFSKRIFNIRKDGNGMAFGKMAETEELLDSAWAIDTDQPEVTMQNLTCRDRNLVVNTEDEINDIPSVWGSHGNFATTLYNKADQITDQPSDNGFVVNITNGPDAADVHQIWADQSGSGLSHRSGNANGWDGTWKTILDSENYSDYVNNDYVNTLSISWDRIIDTPTTLDGYGIVVEEEDDNSNEPVMLYDSTEGTKGTIGLAESAENFTYLEIYYSTEDNMQPHTTKMYSPNNKYITLSCIAPGQYYGYGACAWTAVSSWTISGATMTASYYVQCNSPSGSAFDADGYNKIKIMRVLGYK